MTARSLRPTAYLSNVASLMVKVNRYVRRSRVAFGLTKASATAPLRVLDPTDLDSWEFSAFSAGGEDGIIDYLTRRLREPDQCFIEIGAADGLANNTAWLALARGFRGVMVDGDPRLTRRARTVTRANPLVKVVTLLVDEQNVARVVEAAPSRTPDVMSLDVDGSDYYIARGLIALGVRPKLFVVEYNSAFGPDRRCTVPPVSDDDRPPLYYGVSIGGWKRFLGGCGYRFLGVERTGVNAFFADPTQFSAGFLEAVRIHPFRENLTQLERYGGGWEEQFRSIAHMELVDIPDPGAPA
jgi:hypothetical protein